MEKSNQLLLGVWGGPHCLVSCTLSMKRHLKDSIYRASIEFFLKVCFPCFIIILHATHSSLILGRRQQWRPRSQALVCQNPV